MPFRQIAVVLVALIVIVGAALFVVSWDGDGDDTDGEADTSTTTTSTVSTTTTTLLPVSTTSIPVACAATEETDETDPTDETEEPEETDPADEADESEETDPADEADESEEPVEPTLGPNSSVTTVGLDTVTFGLTVSQAEAAAGTRMVPCAPVSDCYRVTPADAPDGISFVVHEGTIERVDIVDGPITTRSGAGIGTTAERVVELFGDRLERQVLDTSTVDLIFVPAEENDAEFRVAFTVVDGVVDTFRAGRMPLVLEADPCSA